MARQTHTDFLTEDGHSDVHNTAANQQRNADNDAQLQQHTFLGPQERCQGAHFAPSIGPRRTVFGGRFPLQVNVIVIAMRSNARRLQAQHEDQQARSVSRHEQRHLDFILYRVDVIPPVLLLQIDDR